MARIFFVNRFFYPDHSATSQLLTDLATSLAGRGCLISVLTSRLCYDDPAKAFAAREKIKGVDVVRVPTTRFGRANILGRSLDYLSFYVAVFWTLARVVKRGDVVVAKTDPPLVSIVAGAATRLKGGVSVNWLQDVFPEVGAALGIKWLGGPLGKVIRHLRDRNLRAAVENVVLSEGMASYLRDSPSLAGRVSVIPNWADDVGIIPLTHDVNKLRMAWAWQDKFVVVYSGNLGRAHEIGTFLEAAKALAKNARVRFVFIGGGAKLVEARQFVELHRLRNVDFFPYQPREDLVFSLGAADLHMISLLPALERFIFPSKFYGIAAAGRPMVFVGDPDGEIPRFLAKFDCGVGFGCQDSMGLASYIAHLAEDAAEAARLGRNARAALERDLTQQASMDAWFELLHRAAGDGSSMVAEKQ
jgi:glycosyltransferase involved in cell wall biosynthesis